MCGILGSFSFPRESFNTAKTLLTHRGPDENGEFLEGNMFLYNSRLAIQDIISGKQPFYYQQYVIVFNGEIYNHQELRVQFGLKCVTRSDTETLIQLYNQLGNKSLDYLDGMFAVAIYDREKETLFLARDRAGEKPLYYYQNGNRFAFASEMNALVKCCGEKQINQQSIQGYLRYSISGTTTPYKNYFELSPGSWLEYECRSQKINISRWWQIDEFIEKKSDLTIREAVDEINILLHNSVRNQLTSSDLEVATFLSGGIDSGIVTSIAAEYVRNLKTFTVTFEGTFDESPVAKLVSEKYSTDHTVLNISFDDLQTELPKILSNYGEPFADSSAIPSYYICREAKKHVTVALTGDGADELFGGYRRYVPFRYFDFFRPSRQYMSFYGIAKRALPLPPQKHSYYNYFYRLMDLAGKQPFEAYLSSTTDVFEGFDDKFLQGNEFVLNELNNEIERLNRSVLSGLRKITVLDFKYLLNDDFLVKMDIAAMSNSLETRAPFLGKDIIQFAASLPDGFKINGVTTKYLLRILAKKYLPDQQVNLPKQGFEVPLKKWMEFDLRNIVNDYLESPKISDEYLEKKFIQDIIFNKAKIAPEKRAKMLWSLLALEIWYEKCYKAN